MSIVIDTQGDSMTRFYQLPQVLNVGKTLAYTETRILHPESGKLLATGLHTKFVGKSHGHKRNVVFDETGDNIVEGQIEE